MFSVIGNENTMVASNMGFLVFVFSVGVTFVKFRCICLTDLVTKENGLQLSCLLLYFGTPN
jgi:hypothetical protein